MDLGAGAWSRGEPGMDWSWLLAHGGTGGLALEITFILLPFAIFAYMAWRTGRKRKQGEASRVDP